MNGHAAGDELLCWVVEGLRPRGAPAGLGRAARRRRVRDPRAGRRGERRRAHRDPRAQAAVRAGRGLDRHGVLPGARRRPRRASAPRRPPALREQARRRRALHRRPPRADLGRDARARGRRAHGDPDRALDDRRALRRRHRRSSSGWSGADLAHLRIAAMLHDIGKVVLPDRILQKPDSLDELEYEEVKRHPETGAELINRVEGLGQIAEWVRHSHEHFDGSGYPDGLAGDADPAGLAHPAGRRRVRRDHERPPLPRRAVAGTRRSRSCAATPAASSTRAAWTRSRSTSPTPGCRSRSKSRGRGPAPRTERGHGPEASQGDPYGGAGPRMPSLGSTREPR